MTSTFYLFQGFIEKICTLLNSSSHIFLFPFLVHSISNYPLNGALPSCPYWNQHSQGCPGYIQSKYAYIWILPRGTLGWRKITELYLKLEGIMCLHKLGLGSLEDWSDFSFEILYGESRRRIMIKILSLNIPQY